MVLVVGGGVNGLSVAWGLASQGAEVVLVDKGRLGGGASGIAGGIVRNYYRADAITELVRLSVDMFEEDPEAYGFRQVGYLAAVPAEQVEDLVAIREQHSRVGYESELVVGADACREYLTWSWPDWEAPVEALLHERRGGWADAMQTVRHLAARARGAGVEIREGVQVMGFGDGRALTSEGPIEFETLVLATGPWAAELLDPGPALPEGPGRRVHARGRGPIRAGGQRGPGGAPRPDGCRCTRTATAACWWTAHGASTSGWAGPALG